MYGGLCATYYQGQSDHIVIPVGTNDLSSKKESAETSSAIVDLTLKLLLAKLHAYGSSLSALKLIHSYLKNRKQRTKIDSTYTTWEEILFGVPQGSILGPLLFNIFLCDLFFSMNERDFAIYADDKTAYARGDSIEGLINSLENVSITLFKWF